jgi:hypothetical protein
MRESATREDCLTPAARQEGVMKKNRKVKTDEPFAVKVKIEDLKIAQKELHEQTRTAQMKELLRSQDRLINLASQTGAQPGGQVPAIRQDHRPHSRRFLRQIPPVQEQQGH